MSSSNLHQCQDSAFTNVTTVSWFCIFYPMQMPFYWKRRNQTWYFVQCVNKNPIEAERWALNDWHLCSAESSGSPVAVGLLVIILITLLLTLSFVIYKRRRGHFSSTVRYERTYDESDTTSIITEADWAHISNQPQGVLMCLMQMQPLLCFKKLFIVPAQWLSGVICKYCRNNFHPKFNS